MVLITNKAASKSHSLPVSSRNLTGARRIISQEEGRALEMLSHAVDYLLDSYFYSGSEREQLSQTHSDFEAAEILGALNRELLFSLPVVEKQPGGMLKGLGQALQEAFASPRVGQGQYIAQ